MICSLSSPFSPRPGHGLVEVLQHLQQAGILLPIPKNPGLVVQQLVVLGQRLPISGAKLADGVVQKGPPLRRPRFNQRPTAACISVNDEIIHGIPGDRVLHEGDIVSVDVGARYRGFNGDCAGTFPCGKCSDEALRLIRITRQSFFEGIQFARVGYRISDIGHAVQEYAESYGYSLVREYVGHGVGASLHEAPEIPNYGKPGHGPRLQKNMTIAVEPMVNVGGYEVRVLDNGWTVVTADGSLSAHYENSLLVTDGEPEILTFADDI